MSDQQYIQYTIGDFKNDVLLRNQFVVIVPVNYQIIGTCGSCNGPVISPICITNSTESEYCMFCYKHLKKPIIPTYGPIKEMEN
jgi:citrate lyase synthetase